MCISDRWTAYQLDTAVSMVGTVLENAANEMEKVGGDDNPEWKPKYTMTQLLADDFRLPRSGDEPLNLDELKSIDGLIYDEVG